MHTHGRRHSLMWYACGCIHIGGDPLMRYVCGCIHIRAITRRHALMEESGRTVNVRVCACARCVCVYIYIYIYIYIKANGTVVHTSAHTYTHTYMHVHFHLDCICLTHQRRGLAKNEFTTIPEYVFVGAKALKTL